MLQTNQLTRQGHSPTHQQTGCLKTKEPIASSRHAPRPGLAHLRVKIQPHQWESTSTSHKILDQPHPPRDRHEKQESYDPITKARLHPGTSWTMALPTDMPTQPLGHHKPHTPLWQKLSPHPHSMNNLK